MTDVIPPKWRRVVIRARIAYWLAQRAAVPGAAMAPVANRAPAAKIAAVFMMGELGLIEQDMR